MMGRSAQPVGGLLRDWRLRRRMSQLDLACEADISTRHLSFLETGRAQPSRDMVLHLAERLDVPLRERNLLLVAAGYAPVYRERSLADPALQAARKAIDQVLAGHEPFPALAVDRYWNLVASNAMIAPLLKGCDPELLRPPANVLRLSLHPKGLAPRIANLAEWREHLLSRLKHQIDVTADPILIALIDELRAFPKPRTTPGRPTTTETYAGETYAGVAIPFQLAVEGGILSFFSTTTVFGTPIDITLSELALEAFFPADSATAQRLRRIADSSAA